MASCTVVRALLRSVVGASGSEWSVDSLKLMRVFNASGCMAWHQICLAGRQGPVRSKMLVLVLVPVVWVLMLLQDSGTI